MAVLAQSHKRQLNTDFLLLAGWVLSGLQAASLLELPAESAPCVLERSSSYLNGVCEECYQGDLLKDAHLSDQPLPQDLI